MFSSSFRRSIFSNLLAVSALAVLMACAADPAVTAARDLNEQVCTRETPTGSNMSVTRCRTRAQIEQDRAAAQRSLDEAGRTRPRSSTGATN